jgi:hypothetical protein
MLRNAGTASSVEASDGHSLWSKLQGNLVDQDVREPLSHGPTLVQVKTHVCRLGGRDAQLLLQHHEACFQRGACGYDQQLVEPGQALRVFEGQPIGSQRFYRLLEGWIQERVEDELFLADKTEYGVARDWVFSTLQRTGKRENTHSSGSNGGGLCSRIWPYRISYFVKGNPVRGSVMLSTSAWAISQTFSNRPQATASQSPLSGPR